MLKPSLYHPIPFYSASLTEYNRGFMPLLYVESGFIKFTMLKR